MLSIQGKGKTKQWQVIFTLFNTKIHTLIPILLIPLLLVTGCGKWPPSVETVEDIKKLSPDEQSVRARGLSDDDLYALEHLKNLAILDFSGGWKVKEAKISDKGLENLSKLNLPKLETLSLGYNKEISDDGLKYLVNMKSIKWLSLMVCPNTSDNGLKNLVNMSTLESLDLRGCTSITNDGLGYLSKMQNLKHVLLGGCENITDEAVQRLQTNLPHTKVEKDENEWSSHKQ